MSDVAPPSKQDVIDAFDLTMPMDACGGQDHSTTADRHRDQWWVTCARCGVQFIAHLHDGQIAGFEKVQ